MTPKFLYSTSEPCNVTEFEIRQFANSIGIEIPPYKYHSAHDKYDHEGNVLHELGHWAVVPQLIVDFWLNQKMSDEYPLGNGDTQDVDGTKPGIIPDYHGWLTWHINTQVKDAKQLGYRYWNLPDIQCYNQDCEIIRVSGLYHLYISFPIPDEWAVQEWCYQVKQKMGWVCSTSWWDGTYTEVERQQQLKNVGIDVANGVFRPTVTRIDFKDWYWRFFNKRKLLCKSRIFPDYLLTKENIIGFI